eukprot:CAMPEP_0185735564 /NCGR_PEP_ID=MMETSP1171-20130828/25631_1 /TAXON_ID=374046 /ORGANISM="Helicotheca tamensis, Strain CCMP826" /LENGTH=541 /DNA_ID=CAMNT_0028405921 /DNA_START=160 /DNA_END=1785 /DNA_ORIENTATION=+
MKKTPHFNIPSGYRLAKDNLGNRAFVCDDESHHLGSTDKQSSPHKTAPVCIRIQAQPDKPTLSGLTTANDVYQRIQEVIELQNKHRLSSLYKRRWRRRMKDDDDVNRKESGGGETGNNSSCDGGEESRPSWSFAVAQFNALAEGLSSSSASSSMPFSPTSKGGGEDSKFFPSDEYGGFTSVPNPEICLNFDLRRWRILEVLLGGGIVVENVEKNIAKQQQNPSSLSMASSILSPFDIVAMEEIDHYHNFFQPILSEFFGYDSFFTPKPSSPSTKLGWYSDGCALFYKKNVFEFVLKKEGVYDVGTQVYLIVALRHRESGQVLVTASTHLKAKEGELNERIRTAQAVQLCEMVCAVVDKMKKERNVVKHDGESSGKENEQRSRQSGIPVIIMGDFNAEPVGEGRTCVQSVVGKSHSSSFLPGMRSAYKTDPPPDALFTTWKTRGVKTVRRIIDYIFYHNGHAFDQAGCSHGENTARGTSVEENAVDKTKESSNDAESLAFQCTHTLDLPKDHEVDTERLPGFRYPSDHMMIAARFKLEKVQS